MDDLDYFTRMNSEVEPPSCSTLHVAHKIDLSVDKISWNQNGKIFTATVEGRTLVWDDGDVWRLSCDVPVQEEI